MYYVSSSDLICGNDIRGLKRHCVLSEGARMTQLTRATAAIGIHIIATHTDLCTNTYLLLPESYRQSLFIAWWYSYVIRASGKEVVPARQSRFHCLIPTISEIHGRSYQRIVRTVPAYIAGVYFWKRGISRFFWVSYRTWWIGCRF